MTDYRIEQKEAFFVLGIGTALTSHYQDQAGLMREKVAFWGRMDEDPRFDSLMELALNEQVFAVNEFFNGRMMHYAGVMAQAFADFADRLIPFPAGDYLVLEGEADTADELELRLSGIAFGQALAELTQYAYTGGPNALVQTARVPGRFKGEFWVPLTLKKT